MPLRALIFDVDGTLADTEAVHCGAFNDAFAAAGLDWHWDTATYRALLRVTGGKERISHYVEAWLRPPAPQRGQLLRRVAALHADKTRRYAGRVDAGALELRPGIARLAAEARAAGLKLAIATTTSPQNVDALLAAAGGPLDAGMFDCRVCGDEVAAKKPAPDAYLEVLRRLGLAPRDCVAFEDSLNGLHAARAAGIPTVITPTEWSAGEDFGGAAIVLPHLGEPGTPLRGPDAVQAGGPWLGLNTLGGLCAARRVGKEAIA